MRAVGSVRLNQNKTAHIIKSDEFKSLFQSGDVSRLFGTVVKLTSIAKAAGLVPSTIRDVTRLVQDTPEAWDSLITHYDIVTESPEDKDLAISMTREALRISCEMRETEIDFDDQLYLSVVYSAPVPKFDFVLIDEAQDVSGIQRSLLASALKPSGRLIAVGDPHQAIYGFRGADSSSMDNIARVFNTVRLPLSISYRCPKAVVAQAKLYVPHIEAHPDAPEGEVVQAGGYRPDMFPDKCLVVCRNMAPVVRLAYRLIAARRPAKIIGRDLGGGLVALIQRLKPSSLEALVEKLADWQIREIDRLLAKNPEADLSSVEDRVEVIHCFIEGSGAATVQELVQAIEQMFGDKNENCGILLSTIHRAKGLEADTVFFLDSWLVPSRYAKLEWQKRQETNLAYVAVTRARVRLIYISTPK